MELGRRELSKPGIFGSAADILHAERTARTKLAERNRIAESRQAYTVPFASPPVLQPGGLTGAAPASFPRRRCSAGALRQRPPPRFAVADPTMT